MTPPLSTNDSANDAADPAVAAIKRHQSDLRRCRRCPDMRPPVVTGRPVASPVMLVGQAPGAKEGPAGKPFAWTAGKTLFKWFEGIGLDEQAFRDRVYMAAVCRCFPGKTAKGGDRVPSRVEISNCSKWLDDEMDLLRPRLIIPVGKLAIGRFVPVSRLTDVVGRTITVKQSDHVSDCIPLPHPSGASTWHRTLPGKELLATALACIEEHPAWRKLL